MTEPTRAVFLSYASQDAAAAWRICEALRAGGIEVWFDQSELRGGDAWDQKIRREVHDCALFIPIISANTASRHEGYFRLEWNLADQRTQMMARGRAFIVPVCIDNTADSGTDVPESFARVQWTRLRAGETPPTFVTRISQLLAPTKPQARVQVRPFTGSAPASRSTTPNATVSRRGGLLALLIAAVILIAGGYFALNRWAVLKRLVASSPSALAPTGIAAKSIAVLPFADMSEKHDQEYFADGIAEEIIDVLTRIPGMHVIGRTSSFQFKGTNVDLRKIGMALSAAYLVEGSVRRLGDHIRVTAQLIRAADGADEWSGSYERQIDDVLKIQQAIAVGVARALQVTVEAGSFSTSGALNPDAYDFYLRGLSAFGRNDKLGLEEAINDFRNALQLEPSLRRADEALALAEFNLADNVYEPQQIGFARVRQSAEHLLEKNSHSFYGHMIMSRINADFDWDWAAAKREAEEAIAINPSADGGFEDAGVVEGYLGNWDEGERYFRTALSLDPLNADSHYDYASVLLGAGRYSESAAEFGRVNEISPSYAWSHAMAGFVLLAMGQRDAGLHEAQQESMDGAKEFALTVIYHSLGRKADSDLALLRLTRDAADRMAAQIAYAHAYRGEKDQAFEWLERARIQRDTGLPFIKTYSFLLKNIQGDPRYKAFLRRMNLPE